MTKFLLETGAHSTRSTLSYKLNQLGSTRFSSRSTSMACHFQRRDSVTGYWLVNLLTGRRHLFFTMRKKNMCRCGCKGWCSQNAICTYTRWLVDAIHTGRDPRQRHTMEPWRASDRQRVLAGSNLGFVGAMIMVKGDWAEFAVTFGFPTWAQHTNPCFLCDASGGPDGTWRETEGISMFSSPWHAKTFEMYDAACRACESHVHIKNDRRFASVLGATCIQVGVGSAEDRSRRRTFPLSVSPRICVWSRPRRSGVPSSWKSSQQAFLPLVFTSRGGIPPLKLWLPTATPCVALTWALSTFSLTNLHTMHLGGLSRFLCAPFSVGPQSSAMCGARLKAWVCKSPMQMEACGLEYELSQCYKKEKAAGTKPIYEVPDFFIKTQELRGD